MQFIATSLFAISIFFGHATLAGDYEDLSREHFTLIEPPKTIEEVLEWVNNVQIPEGINTVFSNGWSVAMYAILVESVQLVELLKHPSLNVLYRIAPVKKQEIPDLEPSCEDGEEEPERTFRQQDEGNDEVIRVREAHRKVSIHSSTSTRKKCVAGPENQKIEEAHEEQLPLRQSQQRKKVRPVKSDNQSNQISTRKRQSDVPIAIPRHRSVPLNGVQGISASPDDLLHISQESMIGYNALHVAVLGNKIGAVTLMLNLVNPALLSMQDARGDTPLHLAIARRNVEMVRELLSRPVETDRIGLYSFHAQQALATCNNMGKQPIFAALSLLDNVPKNKKLIRRALKRDVNEMILMMLEAGDHNWWNSDGNHLIVVAHKHGLYEVMDRVIPHMDKITFLGHQGHLIANYFKEPDQDFQRFMATARVLGQPFKTALNYFLLSKGRTGPIVEQIGASLQVENSGEKAQKRRKKTRQLKEAVLELWGAPRI